MIIRRTAVKLALAAVVAVAAVPMTAGAAFAAPHAEQMDGSDHGNSNMPARQDPQPDRGQDCLVHGKWGGINEDHCGPSNPDT